MKKTLLAIAAATAVLGTVTAASADFVDAEGDALDTFDMGGPLHDIDFIDVRYTATDLLFTMMFHGAISAPSMLDGNAMVGLLELDTDQSASTGWAPTQNDYSPPFASLVTGFDYVLEFSSEATHPGFVDLYSTEVALPSMIPVVYGPQSISGAIPLSMLGNDDGIVDFTSIIGSSAQPTDATDFVGTSTPLPAPGALALIGLAGLSRRRRRD